MGAAVIVLVIVAGVALIGWRADPMRQFRRTLRQIRELPEHVRKERV